MCIRDSYRASAARSRGLTPESLAKYNVEKTFITKLKELLPMICLLYTSTAFDGNSEAMSGDIDFEENLQRCINLDARYMLFIVDKIANAQNLINEMTIVF